MRKARGNGPAPPAPVTPIWEAYAAAYQERYEVPPDRNAKINGQLKQFVARIPAADAPQVAAFYVGHNDAWYVRRGHPVGAMLADAEKLHTEWRTGKRTTARQSTEQDRLQGQGDIWRQVATEMKRERGLPED